MTTMVGQEALQTALSYSHTLINRPNSTFNKKREKGDIQNVQQSN